MDMNLRSLAAGELSTDLPQTPHDLPYDRGKIDALVDRVRRGEQVDLLTELLNCVDWRGAFADEQGKSLTLEEIARLIAYYKRKFSDVGVIYLAELLSTEVMTEQRARGDIAFSDELMAIARDNPRLWLEIRQFFRRKEFVTALLTQSHASRWARLNPDNAAGNAES